MRLQPVVANSLRRLVVRPVRLSNGFVLPAGVHVELAQYSVMRNPAWGWEAPNTFKPVSREQTHDPVQSHQHTAPDLNPDYCIPASLQWKCCRRGIGLRASSCDHLAKQSYESAEPRLGGICRGMSHCRHSKVMRHARLQERWENPEEEYYLAKHAPDLAGQGSASSAAPALQAGSKARRMHPFGQGIR